MSDSKNQILVQNVETFKTITRLTLNEGETVATRVDQYFSKNSNWGIVSLDDDTDGEYMSVLLVAPVDGPDFIMDETTGEMEPVEKIDPAIELELKMDIMMEINDDLDETIVINPTAFTPPVTLPRTKRNTQSLNKGTKMKAHQYLQQLITATPGISRTDVFQDPGLRSTLLSNASITKIEAGDKLETKRWNRRLNRFIRQIRRDNVDIRIERIGRVAHYTIAEATQLEIPFDLQAEARNSLIIGNDVDNEDLASATPVVFTRADEDENQSLSFEDLLATLDDEAVADVTN